MKIKNRDLRGRVGADCCTPERDSPERDSEHEVQVDFQIAALVQSAFIAQSPFAPGVVRGHASDVHPLARTDRLYGLLDLGAFGHHRVAVRRADVVQVAVHGKSRHVKEEKVERRAALECQATLEKRMTVESLQEIQQVDDLL